MGNRSLYSDGSFHCAINVSQVLTGGKVRLHRRYTGGMKGKVHF